MAPALTGPVMANILESTASCHHCPCSRATLCGAHSLPTLQRGKPGWESRDSNQAGPSSSAIIACDSFKIAPVYGTEGKAATPNGVRGNTRPLVLFSC